MKLVVMRPERFEDAAAIADQMRRRSSIVLNLEATPRETARRLVDFLSGAAYALEGRIRRIAAGTYIITPAKNPPHTLTKVTKKAATCTEPGNVEYYTCDSCSAIFADSAGKTKLDKTVIAPLGHKASGDWKKDNDNHWRICTVCSTVLAETKLAHEMVGGKCSTCGFEKAAVSTKPTTQPSTAPVTVPGTAPVTVPGTEPTVASNTQVTQATVAPETEPVTEPSSAPKTKPTTEPGITPEVKPGTEKTAPTSEPSVDEEDGGSNLLWLWITLAVVAAGGGFALYWFVLRKKRNT